MLANAELSNQANIRWPQLKPGGIAPNIAGRPVDPAVLPVLIDAPPEGGEVVQRGASPIPPGAGGGGGGVEVEAPNAEGRDEVDQVDLGGDRRGGGGDRGGGRRGGAVVEMVEMH